MALIRVTAATALPSVRQFAVGLRKWAAEAGPLSAAPDLLARFDALAQPARELAVDVLVGDGGAALAPLISPQLEPSALVPLPRAPLRLGGAVALDVRVAGIREGIPVVAGEARAPILVVLAESVDAASLEAVRSAAEDRPIVAVLPALRAALGPLQAWHVLTIGPGEPPLHERFAAAPYSTLVDPLVAYGVLRAVESLASVLALAMETEQRGNRARKAVVQQRQSAMQRPAGGSDSLASELRARLQRQIAEFKRGIEDRAQTAMLPQVGTLSAALDAEIEAIDALVQEPRGRSFTCRLSPDVEDAWYDSVYRRLDEHCRADSAAMAEFFRQLQRDVERTFASAGAPPTVVQFQPLAEERRERVLRMHVTPQRRYSGEVPRPGFFEYVMMARRYQMIVFMMISAFGLSFLRSYREFMLPAAILLLSFGAMSVAATTRRERIEGRRKELARAREALHGEARRMLDGVQRGWTSLVADHLTEQKDLAIARLDGSLREFQAGRQQTDSQDKQNLARQLTGLDHAFTKLTAAAKGRELEANHLAQLKSELRTVISTELAGGARA